jgi:hypothetical protein
MLFFSFFERTLISGLLPKELSQGLKNAVC